MSSQLAPIAIRPTTNQQYFKTKKAARAAGLKLFSEWIVQPYLVPRCGEVPYVVKGDEFFSKEQCEELLAQTAAGKRGLKLKTCARPITSKRGRSMQYKVYRLSDFEPKRVVKEVPAEKIDTLLATFTVNRATKRYRDAAASYYGQGLHGFAGYSRRTKEHLYRLKEAGISWAFKNSLLDFVGIHGSLALYRGSGYCFHSVLVPVEAPIQELSDEQFFKEAQPKECGEAKQKDAVHTLQQLPEPTGFRRLDPPRVERKREYMPRIERVPLLDDDSDEEDDWEFPSF